MCGGNRLGPHCRQSHRGLSPRVRGKPIVDDREVYRARSIPACAGETFHRPGTGNPHKVYPRVCGGNATLAEYHPADFGLSPRVRGKLGITRPADPMPRSIPACAGETQVPIPLVGAEQVYPRVCGGNMPSTAAVMSKKGLSPRVRGKPHPRRGLPLGTWSIPACAGETILSEAGGRMGRVYPRVCGGNRNVRLI